MGGLGPLLASLAAVDIAAFTHKLKRNAILYAIALIFLLTAYALGLAALAVYLGQIWGLPIGLLVVAGGALVLALIMVLSAAMANRAEVKRKKEAVASSSSNMLMMTAAVSALPLVLRSRSLITLAIAGGIGFAAIKSLPKRRRLPPDAP